MAQKSLNDYKTQLNKLNGQKLSEQTNNQKLHAESENDILVDSSYTDVLNKYTKIYRDQEAKDHAAHNYNDFDSLYDMTYRKPEFIKEIKDASDKSYALTQYKHSDYDKNRIVDVAHLTPEQNMELNIYTINLINSVRNQIGVPPLKLNNDAIRFAQDVRTEYQDNHKQGNSGGHYVEGIERAAHKNGLDNSGQLYENMSGFYDNTEYNENAKTADDAYEWAVKDRTDAMSMDHIKEGIFEVLKVMLFNDTEWYHATGLTNTIGYDLENNTTFGMSLSTLPDTSLVTIHLLSVLPSLVRDSNIYHINNDVQYDDLAMLKERASASDKVLTNLNNQISNLTAKLNSAQNAVNSAQIAKSNAQIALTNAQNNLKASQIALTNAQVAKKFADNNVSSANNNLASAQATYQNLLNDLANKKQILAEKQNVLANAQTELAKVNQNLATKKQILANATNTYNSETAKLNDLTNHKFDLEKQTADSTKTLAILTKQDQDLTNIIKSDNTNLTDAKTAAAKFADVLKQKQAQINEAQSAVQTAQSTLHPLFKELSNRIATLNKTIEKVNDTAKQVTLAQEQLTNAKNEVTASTQKLNDLENAPQNLKKAQNDLQLAQAQQQEAQQDLLDANSAVATAQSNLDSAKDRLQKAQMALTEAENERQSSLEKLVEEEKKKPEPTKPSVNKIDEAKARKEIEANNKRTHKAKTTKTYPHKKSATITYKKGRLVVVSGKRVRHLKYRSLKQLMKLVKYYDNNVKFKGIVHVKAKQRVHLNILKNNKMHTNIRTVKPFSSWIAWQLKVVNDQLYIRIGTNRQWINAKYVNFK